MEGAVNVNEMCISMGAARSWEERKKGKAEGESETIENSKSLDIRNDKPKRMPQLMWRECSKRGKWV